MNMPAWNVSATLLITALYLPIGANAQSLTPAKQASPSAQLQAAPDTADAAVTDAETRLRLITAGYQAGTNSSSDVSEATITLAQAQIRFDIEHKQRVFTSAALGVVVSQNERLFKDAEVRYKQGAINTDSLTEARIVLAQAHVSLDLYNLAVLQNQNLVTKQARYREGAISPKELMEAETISKEAQRHFEASQQINSD